MEDRVCPQERKGIFISDFTSVGNLKHSKSMSKLQREQILLLLLIKVRL